MSAISRVLSASAFPILLSTAAGAACLVVAGPSLNWFLGALLFLTIAMPPLSVAHERTGERLAAACAVALPILVISFVVRTRSTIIIGEWASCAAVLFSFGFALAGLSVGLRLAGWHAAASAAVPVMAGLGWVTWPIWMARAWQGNQSAGTIEWVGRFHPGMLIDGQLAARVSGGWSLQNVAYHLTELSQSVTYSPSQFAWFGVLVYAVLGGTFFFLAFKMEGRGNGLAISVPPPLP